MISGIIHVKRILKEDADWSDQGEMLLDLIVKNLRQFHDVIVDFSEVKEVPADFIFSSFIKLLQDITRDDFQKRIKIINMSEDVSLLVETFFHEEIRQTSVQ